MTPEEKANFLYDEFLEKTDTLTPKQCCLILVNEIISTIEFMAESDEIDKLPFWQEVKEEIEKI